ncbi:Peptide chain release factor 1 [Thermodesulfobium narugense DSM 14796]|uniref:Peptide chain release factor 1 n=1 Tax=Thermodesulfobium narugense DSM 14796 TaxID=747365 RepID=M1E5J9_9BACT|nr:peptide chain release factor 1 [Thermodesulfobium narugense]AEE14311.1 Peptide chain release factor 1 [Thermodesulfobium narugense DSM 14796]
MDFKVFEGNILKLINRYKEINELLSSLEIINNPSKLISLSQEKAELEEVVNNYNELNKLKNYLSDLKELKNSEDEEIKALAEEEFQVVEKNIENLESKLLNFILPKDPLDEKNIILEIRAGAGGEEAALFASELLRMYLRYAERKNAKTEILSINETGIGGIKEAIISIKGKRIYSRLKFESGTHRVQRVPETESGGRIHTSTATVAVLPEADEIDITIDEKDLKIDTFRAGGAGGQHVNKTDSAVRITHLPTGIVVACQDERSQFQNKEKAMRILAAKILEEKRVASEKEIAMSRRIQVGSGDRSEKIRTYNFPQGRVTDHRINLTLYRLNEVLDGDLDEIIDALIAAENIRKLELLSVK